MNTATLPTAATSFYTVRKVRGGWGVLLVTPSGGGDLTTHLCTMPDRAAAIDYAKALAARVQRPFTLRRVAQ